MVAGNTIVSFLCLFGVSLDAGLVAGSTSLTLSLSLTLTLALSLSHSLSPLPLPAPPAAMQLSPTGLTAYTMPQTGLQPFLSLPYAGVYTLPDNSVQGVPGPFTVQLATAPTILPPVYASGHFFPFLVLPLPAPPHTFPFPSLRRGLHPTG